MHFAILLTDHQWSVIEAHSLAHLRQQLKLPSADVHVWATRDKAYEKFTAIRSEDEFCTLRGTASSGFVYLKLGHLTPSNSPDALDKSKRINFDSAAIRKVLLPPGEVSVLYRDSAVKDTIGWIQNTTATSTDRSVAMILAPPGSGKSRTPFAAAGELEAVEYLRFKLTTSEMVLVDNTKQCVDSLIVAHEREEFISKECYKSYFYPLFQKYVQSWISAAEELRSKTNCSIVVLHLDEIQVLLPTIPPQQKGSSNIRDFILAALADTLNTLIVRLEDKSWMRVILTGTNFFSPLAIQLASALKLLPIGISGSFPVDWVCDELLEKEFPLLVSSFGAYQDWFLSQIRFVSANRRCV